MYIYIYIYVMCTISLSLSLSLYIYIYIYIVGDQPRPQRAEHRGGHWLEASSWRDAVRGARWGLEYLGLLRNIWASEITSQ